MTVYEIALKGGPQTFPVKLGAAVYRITLAWRAASEGGWFFDIATPDGAPVLAGFPLIPGRDLLAQHQHLGLGHLRLTVDGTDAEAPGFDDLSGRARLYWWPA